MHLRLLGLLLLLGTCSLPAWAQPAPAPGLDPQIRLVPLVDSVLVGERFRLALIVEHAPGRTLLLPSPPPLGPGGLPQGQPLRLGDVDVLALIDSVRVAASSERVRDSLVYEAAAFATDSALVAPFPVGFAVGGDTLRAAADSLYLPVRSVVPPEAQEIQGLAPLVEFRQNIWFWVLLVVAGLILAGMIWYVLRARRRREPVSREAPPPVRSPYEQAQERLQALETFDLDGTPDVKPFYVALTDALRAYLAARIGVSALEMTSRELLDTLARHADRRDVPEPVLRSIRSVLATADLAKFADIRPSPSEGRAALAETRAAIDQIEDARRRAEAEALRQQQAAAPASADAPAS